MTRGACVDSPAGLSTTRICSSSKMISGESMSSGMRSSLNMHNNNKKSPGLPPWANGLHQNSLLNLAFGRHRELSTIFAGQHCVGLFIADKFLGLRVELQ